MPFATLGLSANAFARLAGVTSNRITRIINGQMAVTAETPMLFGCCSQDRTGVLVNLPTT